MISKMINGQEKPVSNSEGRKNCFRRIDISSYTDRNNKYIIPEDGYIYIACGGSDGAIVRVELWGADDVDYFVHDCFIGEHRGLFVRKGMKVYVTANTGSNNIIRYMKMY